VRIEDDVLVAESGPKLLSATAPRTIEEIERWMGSDI
jgi:Xaa-Pro aminopeptidase